MEIFKKRANKFDIFFSYLYISLVTYHFTKLQNTELQKRSVKILIVGMIPLEQILISSTNQASSVLNNFGEINQNSIKIYTKHKNHFNVKNVPLYRKQIRSNENFSNRYKFDLNLVSFVPQKCISKVSGQKILFQKQLCHKPHSECRWNCELMIVNHIYLYHHYIYHIFAYILFLIVQPFKCNDDITNKCNLFMLLLKYQLIKYFFEYSCIKAHVHLTVLYARNLKIHLNK
eukprot:TRINITY_DN9826_c0_g1_i11.p1 TRINITY_DN9826_c0_g1~~TRINITY_DN9826_c0_g1_i11.p1  ORF type:complete len:231 (+),score=-21.75 TRINITY_DN9826_c0_g1_i11:367-1059(+)